MKHSIEDIIDQVVEKEPKYKEDAYLFVMEALSFTQKKFKRPKHVDGDELLDGIRELLLKNFGPMAMSVLKHWGIRQTEDFGQIVFRLIDCSVLSKTENDCLEQFKDGYDFNEAFNQAYRKDLHKKIGRMKSI